MTFFIFEPLTEAAGWTEDRLQAAQAAPWWVWLFLIIFLLFLGIGLWLRSRGQGLVKPEKNLMNAAMEPKSKPRGMLAPEKTVPETEGGAPAKQDELAIIFGIGPQIANLLKQAGIDSFARLAATPPARITEIMRAASPGTRVDPSTWPVQARLAAEARWGELQEYQQSLREKG